MVYTSPDEQYGSNPQEPGYEIGIALGRSDEEQGYHYKGKTWKADDIYRVMTAAENQKDDNSHDYVVASVDGIYLVLAEMQNGTYEVYGRFGDIARRARVVAKLLNDTGGGSVDAKV